MNILALTTSYTFEFAFIYMIAASFYFLLERHKLSSKYKSISSLAFLTTALAVIEYYQMSDFFDIENLYFKENSQLLLIQKLITCLY